MTHPEIARRRLHNQLLTAPAEAPAEVVRHLGAVQSQDYAGGKWAIAQRCAAVPTSAEMESALDRGEILRTHVLRPTWHLVHAADLRWMLALTGPRVLKGSAARHRELQLDDAVFEHCQRVFRQRLRGGSHCTRAELESALNQAGIFTDLPQRFVHILMQSELTGLITSGKWRGKQNTYALLDERVPPGERTPDAANDQRDKRTPQTDPINMTGYTQDRDAAGSSRSELTAELVRRFFTSHGPATIKDFAWWSGLTLGDARGGIAALGDALLRERIDGQEYYGPPGSAIADPGPDLHLLPNYDEYVVAYTDRTAIFDPKLAHRLHMRGGVLNNVIIAGGLVIGGWSRALKKNRVIITARPFEPLPASTRRALEQAAHQYAAHLELEPEVIIEP